MQSRKSLVLGALLAGGVTATIAARHESGVGDNDPKPVALPVGDSEPPRLDPELVTALYRVDLRPENLAIASVPASLADDIVLAVKDWLEQQPNALLTADQRYFDAITNRDRLVRLVVSGQASEQEIIDCQLAKAEFDTADLARKATLDSVFNAGALVVSPEANTLLSRVRANEAAWDGPTEYFVVDRSQVDWVHLSDALANERIAFNRNEPPDPDEQAFLSVARADPVYAAAKTSHDTTLAAVKAAWEAAAAEDE